MGPKMTGFLHIQVQYCSDRPVRPSVETEKRHGQRLIKPNTNYSSVSMRDMVAGINILVIERPEIQKKLVLLNKNTEITKQRC